MTGPTDAPVRAVRGGPFAALLARGNASALRKPPHVFELPLSAWADGHADKPAAPTVIGMRLPSDEDERRAEDEADKAVETFASSGDIDSRIRARNSALISELVAASTCQASDVTQAFFETASLDVRRRLTTAGVQRLWQELQTLKASTEPGMPELDVEGLAHLTAMLDRGVGFDHMPREEAKRLRRLLEHVRLALSQGEEVAERNGVALYAEGTSGALAREEPPSDLDHVLSAIERRQRAKSTG